MNGWTMNVTAGQCSLWVKKKMKHHPGPIKSMFADPIGIAVQSCHPPPLSNNNVTTVCWCDSPQVLQTACLLRSLLLRIGHQILIRVCFLVLLTCHCLAFQPLESLLRMLVSVSKQCHGYRVFWVLIKGRGKKACHLSSLHSTMQVVGQSGGQQTRDQLENALVVFSIFAVSLERILEEAIELQSQWSEATEDLRAVVESREDEIVCTLRQKRSCQMSDSCRSPFQMFPGPAHLFGRGLTYFEMHVFYVFSYLLQPGDDFVNRGDARAQLASRVEVVICTQWHCLISDPPPRVRKYRANPPPWSQKRLFQ